MSGNFLLMRVIYAKVTQTFALQYNLSKILLKNFLKILNFRTSSKGLVCHTILRSGNPRQ